MSIWKDLISNARDLDDIAQGLEECGFSTRMGIPARLEDFLVTRCETITVGISPVELPPCIYETDLTPYIGPGELNRRRMTDLDEVARVYGSREPATRMSNKFSATDNTLLLGALTPEALIALVTSCGFMLEASVQEIFARLGLIYFAECEGQIFHEASVDDLLALLKDQGYDLLDELRVEEPMRMAVPPSQRRLGGGNNPVALPPYIFSAHIVPTGRIATTISRRRPYWITLGAETEEALNNLVGCSGLEDKTTPTSISPSSSRQTISDDVKMFVWKRDEGRCVKCGSQVNLEFDHIIPVAMGGSSTARNIQLLCESCNRAKGKSLTNS